MVNIDALLSEWAYRCEKGYPDMDSPSDLRVLKTILKEQGISLPSNTTAIVAEMANFSSVEDVPNTNTETTGADLIKVIKSIEDKLTPDMIDQLGKSLSIQADPSVFNLNEDEEPENEYTLEFIYDFLEQNEDNPLLNLGKVMNFLYTEVFGPDFEEYFEKKGGKSMTDQKALEPIKSAMIAGGDVLKFKKYIDNPKSWDELYGEKGDLLSPFRKMGFSDIFLNKLLKLDGSFGGIAIGKGEFFLCTLCKDIKFGLDPDIIGDVQWGNKGMEIKNQDAKPIGQKAEYGANSQVKIFKDIFKFFKEISTNIDPSKFGIQKNKKTFIPIKDYTKLNRFMKDEGVLWPYKLNRFYQKLEAFDNEKALKSKFIDIVKTAYSTSYSALKGTEAEDISKYFNDKEFNAKEFTLKWSKSITKQYMDSHKFDVVLFMNDKTGGKFTLVPYDEVLDKLTTDKTKPDSVWMTPKDGLPRWTATDVF